MVITVTWEICARKKGGLRRFSVQYFCFAQECIPIVKQGLGYPESPHLTLRDLSWVTWCVGCSEVLSPALTHGAPSVTISVISVETLRKTEFSASFTSVL